MPTPIFICGAECGIAAFATSSGGVEHWSGSSGMSIVTSGPSPMRSTRCFAMPSSGSLTHTFGTAIAAPATVVLRGYVYFPTGVTGFPTIVVAATGSATGRISFDLGSNTMHTQAASSAGGIVDGANSAIPARDTWLRVDLKVVLGATTTADAIVGGVTLAQASDGGGVDTASTNWYFAASSISGGTVYYDDFIVSATAADYPIGEGIVAGLYPNGDLTNSAAYPTQGNDGHYYSATTDFGKGAGGGTALAAQNVESTSWQSLQKPLSTTIPTNFISNRTGSGSEILMWELEDLPSDAQSVNGVMLVCTTHSASATGNEFKICVYTNGTYLTQPYPSIVGDLSETTITVPCVISKPNTGDWTVAYVNGSKIRFGDSADVNPDSYLDGVCLEVDYVPKSGGLAVARNSVRSQELIRIGGF